MQIARFGFSGNKPAVAQARRDFAQCECAVLPEFLAPDLVARFTHDLDLESYVPVAHHFHGDDDQEFGRDLSVSQTSPALHALHLLFNNPKLFEAIREVAGCAPIGCFMGRIYRNLSSPEYHLDWHDDMQEPGRLIGLSLSLTTGSSTGGEFRVRRKSSREILAEIHHDRPGNAHIFRIDPGIEHCVTPVTSGMPRTAFAGWFQSSPDQNSLVRSLFGA